MAAADRHLLFGLIALQVGLVDQAQLVAAFQAWARDKARPLADHLADRGGPDADGRAAVEALVAVHLKAHGGDPEKSLASIPVGPSARERLTALGDPELTGTVAHLGPGSTQADDGRTLAYAGAAPDGQRFRVLRPHAKGGLGAVFVALDRELHREVALKQILDAHADDPVSRQRFLLEAEITGGLEHPGIVPVYGLGTYADGRPYYAMRFIRGDSLKRAIARFHAEPPAGADRGLDDSTPATRTRELELRRLLRRFLDVCNAIEYAHARGVLHRDIKPGNVIVGKHGETLVVDWGLAKPLGKGEPGADTGERTLVPSSASGSAETLPGSALGTPAYMSPEQAAGDFDRLGPRSDVYSLGATLYCLLTGRPPLDGEVGEVLRRVQEGDFPPPRRHDPSLDRALEAVCLKALSNRPEDRYASCRALADDVERWMADEPVSAYAERPAEKLARWSRRHRAWTRAAAATLVVLAVSSTAAALAIGGARQRERAALRQAEVNLRRADENFRTAQRAVDDSFTRVSENTLLKVPSRDLRALRKELLSDSLKYYQAFAAQQADNPALRRELARAYARVGAITSEIGTRTAALAAYRKALEIRRALAAARPGDAAIRVELAETLVAVGDQQRSLGAPGEAMRSYEESRATVEPVAAANPADAAAQFRLGVACGYIGALNKVTGNFAAARPLTERARSIMERLAAAHPEVPKYQRHLAWFTYNLGNLHSYEANTGGLDLDRAKAYFAAARSIQEKLAAAHPESTDYPEDMAQCDVSLAHLLSQQGDEAAAIRALSRALAIQQKLVAAHPDVTAFLLDVAATLYNLGNRYSDTNRLDDAERVYRSAVEIGERLVALDPDNLDFQSRLSETVNNLGNVYLDRGQAEPALKEYRKAIEHQRPVYRKAPNVGRNQGYLFNPLINSSRALRVLGRPAAALPFVAEAWEIGKGRPDDLVDVARELAAASGLLADGGTTAGRAVTALREALAAGFRRVERVQNDADFAPLAPRRDFQELIYDPGFPADPFAR